MHSMPMDLKPLIPWVAEAESELGILFLVPEFR